MTNVSSMTREEIHAFLSRGSLGTYRTKNAQGELKYATDIILDAARTFNLNPQLLLVTLQKEQSLVEDPSPSQNQLDWAMGYAICDSCSKSDPRLQTYKGFGNQVYQAARNFRESYLQKLESSGTTKSGYGPGIQTRIDETVLTPQNNATAALYTYTPHLHGNFNFMSIWNRWFTKNYPTGTLLQDKKSGAVWLIQDGKKRPIISWAALASRFNPSAIIPTNAQTLASYPEGTPINFPNYSLLRDPSGNIFLITDDAKRKFVSMRAFHDAGFIQDDVVEATYADLSAFSDAEPIQEKTARVYGTLVQDARTGGIFHVTGETKSPVFSKEILLARFGNMRITSQSTESLRSLKTEHPVLFPDGTLVGARGSADVFVIESGMRRPIQDAATFLTYGWKWHQIYWTTERAVLLHPLGTTLSTKLPNDPA